MHDAKKPKWTCGHNNNTATGIGWHLPALLDGATKADVSCSNHDVSSVISFAFRLFPELLPLRVMSKPCFEAKQFLVTHKTKQ
eukprot:13199709-Ditylum_brightwellii.AAC.1